MRTVQRLSTLLWLSFVGCGPTATQPGGNADAAPKGPLTVKTANVETKTLTHVIELPGYLEAFEETPIFARIPGYVRKVGVDIGDKVEGPRLDAKGDEIQPGQLLAELWVPEVDADLRQKTAQVARSVAAVEQAKAALTAAEAHELTSAALVKEAEAGRTRAEAGFARWQSESKRIEKLVQQNVIDRQTLDETTNQLRSAEAARLEAQAKVLTAETMVKEQQANVLKAKADVTAASAQVQVAQAEEGRAAAMVRYGKLTAPFAGVITRRQVSTGHFVQPAMGGGTQPLFVVARMDIIRVFVDVPESETAFVGASMPAVARVPALKDAEFEAKVTRSSGSFDSKARTLRLEIDLPNRDGPLRPGMYASVKLRAEFKDRRAVPSVALFPKSNQTYCFFLENGKASLAPVKTGVREGTAVEIVAKQVVDASGAKSWRELKGDEVVIMSNLSELKDGDAVKIFDKIAGE